MAKADIEDHTSEVKRKVEKAIEKALTMIGGIAETAVKQKLTDNGSVDTGLLRNSITWALGGEYPAVMDYATNAGGKTKDGKDIEKKEGHYTMAAPADEGDSRSVYIGTNVEYAPYVELGTSRNKHPKPYLRPGVEESNRKFQQAITLCFKDVK